MPPRPPDEPEDIEYAEYADDDFLEEEESPVPARPRRYAGPPPPPGRPPPARPPLSSGPARPRHRPPAYMPPPPARSPTWQNVALGFIGAALLGMLGLLVFLVIQRNNPPAALSAAPTLPVPGNNTGAAAPPPGAPAASSSDPPRISLETFKKLYDDPAQRPPIFDVRAADVYAAGHIVGARSLPEAEVDARYSEVPKDRLVVLYCQ